jgi:anti-sigma B factor antagonist
MSNGTAGNQDWRAGRAPETAEFSRHSPSPGLGVLTVRGELDISTSGRLHQELKALLDAGTERVEIDLSGVVFMDSSALSALVGAHDRAGRQSQQLTLASPSPACAKVLGITGLDQIFDLT